MATREQTQLVQQCHERIKPRIRQLSWRNVSADERHFENVLALYADIEGNGLNSIFFNSQYLGDMADELLESLSAVGASKAAEIFARSFTYFPSGKVPEGLDARCDVLQQKGDVEFFSRLGDEFYASAEERDMVLHSFILAHAAEFERLHGVSYRD